MDDRYQKLMGERAKKTYREYDKYSDDGLNNIRKSADSEREYLNKRYSEALPIDEMATMGSDTQIHRDHSKMSPEFKKKWDDSLEPVNERSKISKAHLNERGYKEEFMKKTKNNPDGYKTKFVNKTLGKTLKGLAAIGILSASDMASAAVGHVVPGGVEDMGVSAEQKDLDKRYQETLKRRSLNQK